MSAEPPLALPPDVRQVLLFAGHRVDAPQRARPRFPPALVGAVERRIEAQLERWDAGAGDIALSQAAAGGDLLFIDACLRRGVRCRVLLPEDEAAFVAESILTSRDGAGWHARWQTLRPRLDAPPHVLPPRPDAGNRYERCNRWLLGSALGAGAERLRVLCVWNGEPADGPGGVDQLIAEARRHTDRVALIDTQALLRQLAA